MTEEREWDGAPVSSSFWGKDHLSTLIYIETRCVDWDGHVDPDHMREGEAYPTVLKGDAKLLCHDDWDCVDDLEAAGMLERVWTGAFRLTDRGWYLVGCIRRHLAERPSGTRSLADFPVVEVLLRF